MIEAVLKDIIEKNSAAIQESEIKVGDNSYWQSTVLDKNEFPLGSGFHAERMQARKIGVVEFIERLNFFNVYKSSVEEQEKWGHHIIPTGCGYAAGFNKNNVIFRSIQEAAERWVMSLWIDDQYNIPSLPLDEVIPGFGKGSLYLYEQFDQVKFYEKELVVYLNNNPVKIRVAQTMGLKDGGIFPGSSTRSIGEGIWEHALLESFRHLKGVKNNPVRKNKFPDNRVHFFSENAEVALKQISQANKVEWPQPKIKHFHVEPILDGEMFVARTIFDGWKSWDKGNVERFLY